MKFKKVFKQLSFALPLFIFVTLLIQDSHAWRRQPLCENQGVNGCPNKAFPPENEDFDSFDFITSFPKNIARLTFRVDLDLSDSDAGSEAEQADLVQFAVDAWNRVNTNLHLTMERGRPGDFVFANAQFNQDLCEGAPDFCRDGVNMISELDEDVHDAFCQHGLFDFTYSLGFTISQPVYEEGEYERDIAICDGVNWFNFQSEDGRDIGEQILERDEHDLASMLIHEIGHAIGLGHANINSSSCGDGDQPEGTESVMDCQLDINTVNRTLSDDDISGIQAAYGIAFDDVEEGNWFFEAVNELVIRGVVEGYVEDNTFRPFDDVTRAEFIKMLVAAKGLDLPFFICPAEDVFSDVGDHWSCRYISAAIDAGWIDVDDDWVDINNNGRFHPDREITRGEVVTYVERAVISAAMKNEIEDEITNPNTGFYIESFSDVAANQRNTYYYESVYLSKYLGIIQGYNDGTFRPLDNIVRAEAAIVILKAVYELEGSSLSRDFAFLEGRVFEPLAADPNNRSPRAILRADSLRVNSGARIQMNLRASSDPDGDDLSYFWQFDAGEIRPIRDNFDWIEWQAPVVQRDTTYVIRGSVSDNRGGEDHDDVQITVEAEVPQPERYTLYGHVTNQEGQAIPGAQVSIFNTTTDGNYGRVITDEEGYFERGALAEGNYRINIFHPLHNSRTINLFLAGEGRRIQEDIQLTFNTYEIEGLVRLANGDGIANIEIRATGQGREYLTQTDQDGNFRFELPHGNFTFIPSHPNYFMSPLSSEQEIYNANFGLPRIEFTASAQMAAYREMSAIAGVQGEGISMGVAVGDYNNDGFEDIYVNTDSDDSPNHLFRNNGDETFTDVAQEAGVADRSRGTGAVFGDYNNDGWLDIYVSNGLSNGDNANRLYRNNGDGTFTDVAPQLGLDFPNIRSLGASFGDYDADGDLDLYLGETDHAFEGINRIFRNDNQGEAFVEVTQEIFAEGSTYGHGAAGTWIDFDLDNDLDLSIALGGIFRQEEGNFNDREVGIRDSYGIAWGDYNRDSYPDYLRGRSGGVLADVDQLYESRGGDRFFNVTERAELGFPLGSLGIAFADYNNDGWLDIHASGLFESDGDGTFTDVTEEQGMVRCRNACVWFDYNNDGILDVYVADTNDNFLFKGQNMNRQMLTLKLRGQQDNYFGLGAKVIVTTPDGEKQYAQMINGSGWNDGLPPVLYFGLGAFDSAESIRVIWPNGIEDEVYDSPGNQVIEIRQGDYQDVTAPAAINTLAVSNKTTDSITLTWDAPGDDGFLRQASAYDIRYALVPIDENNWDDATQVENEPLPALPGVAQEFTVEYLLRNRVYYFAIRSVDEMGNVSALSNIIFDRLAYGETVFNLSVGSINETSVVLQWTVPDLEEGSYEVAVSNESITLQNWDEARILLPQLEIGRRGDILSFEVENLNAATHYFFAIRVRTTGVLGDLSNVVSVTTALSAWNQLSHLAQIEIPGRVSVQSIDQVLRPLRDVNGDGVDDFAVTSDEGIVYLYEGSLNFDLEPDKFFSEYRGDYYGNVYRSAGNINGDDGGRVFYDLVISQMFYEDGRVLIYHGGENMNERASQVIDAPAELEGTGFHFGRGVGAIPDLSGDGIDELIVFTAFRSKAYIYYERDNDGDIDTNPDNIKKFSDPNEESFYGWDHGDFNGDGHFDICVATDNHINLYYGGPANDQEAFLDEGDLPEHTLLIETPNDNAVGDINGDGFDDILIGASQDAHIIWGHADAALEPEITVISFDDANGNSSVALVDLDNDSLDDVVIGLPRADSFYGRVEIFLGKRDFENLDLVSDIIIRSAGYRQSFGHDVSSVGDVNADGFEDLGVSGSHEVFIYEGRPNLRQRDDVLDPETPGDFQTSGNSIGELVVSWTSPGDNEGRDQVNFYDLRYLPRPWEERHWVRTLQVQNEELALEEGYVQSHTFTEDDLVGGLDYYFGIKASDEWLNFSGVSNIISGHLMSQHHVKTLWSMEAADGNRMGSGNGASVGKIDLNDDGFEDLVIGNHQDNTNDNFSGALHIYLSTGDPDNEGEPAYLQDPETLLGQNSFNYLGQFVNSGDFDGDRIDDLVYSDLQNSALNIYRGGEDFRPQLDIVPDVDPDEGMPLRLLFQDTIEDLEVGNFNGDDRDDLLVKTGNREEPVYYIYTDGPNFVADPIQIQSPSDSYMGERQRFVIGDFDNDGTDDIAFNRSVPGFGEEVALYFGSEIFAANRDQNNVVQMEPMILEKGEDYSGLFGRGLGNAGDINGDGFEDLAVGDIGSQSIFPSYEDGLIKIYLGGRPFDNSPDMVILPLPSSSASRFSEVIESIGDINNDGFDDLLIGGQVEQNGDRIETLFVLFGSQDLDSEIDFAMPNSIDFYDFYDNNFAIETLGDMDGNGFPEFLVGNFRRLYIHEYNNEPRQLPLADAGEDQEVQAGEPVSLEGLGESLNGDIQSFRWMQVKGYKVNLDNPNIANPGFIAPEREGVLRFRLVVDDELYPSEGDTVDVSVVINRDQDNDGVLDLEDNCPDLFNPDQTNNDGDERGDLCDPDDDNDGVLDEDDAFPFDPNESSDEDADGIGDNADFDNDNDGVDDVDDNCLGLENPSQVDFDGDGFGDHCDDDQDNDGVDNFRDRCFDTALGVEVNSLGCSENQSFCDSLQDVAGHDYEDAICYLVDGSFWWIEDFQFNFFPDDLIEIHRFTEVALRLTYLYDQAVNFQGGFCDLLPLISFSHDQGLFDGALCPDFRDNINRRDFLESYSRALVLESDDKALRVAAAIRRYNGPNFDFASPFAIAQDDFNLAFMAEALVDFDEEGDPQDLDYGLIEVTQGEAAFIFFQIRNYLNNLNMEALDTDGDGIPDEEDDCPDIPNDGIGDDCVPNDCPDLSPEDAVGDPCNHDEDGDGVPDDEDDCPFVPNDNRGDACDPDDCGEGFDRNEEGECVERVGDEDNDGVLDDVDNCTESPNPNQSDIDGDGIGDVCDPDIDGDRLLNEEDNCSLIANPDQNDLDQDGLGNLCDDDIDGDDILNQIDACPEIPNDDVGNACDPNDCHPGFVREGDQCLESPDTDEDGVFDHDDNCVDVFNPDQIDFDQDGLGNLCDADDDNDGVEDAMDECDETIDLNTVNEEGCSEGQLSCNRLFDIRGHIYKEEICYLVSRNYWVLDDDNINFNPNEFITISDQLKLFFNLLDSYNEAENYEDNSCAGSSFISYALDQEMLLENQCVLNDSLRSRRAFLYELHQVFLRMEDGGLEKHEEILSSYYGRDFDEDLESLYGVHRNIFIHANVMGAIIDFAEARVGSPDENFYGEDRLTRAQVAYMTYSYLGLSNDDDTDAIPDNNDHCPYIRNDNIADPCNPFDCNDGSLHDPVGDACDHDEDDDGVNDLIDNCPEDSNPDQNDFDGDGIGDVCDDGICDDGSRYDVFNDPCNHDEDGDGILDNADACPYRANDRVGNACEDDCDDFSPQDNVGDSCNHDEDADGIDDLNDNCPFIANPDQIDFDQDTKGDLCDTDSDGDGFANHEDICPQTLAAWNGLTKYGCAPHQNLCSHYPDISGHEYEDEICYLVNNTYWELTPDEELFGVNEFIRLRDWAYLILSLEGYHENLLSYENFICGLGEKALSFGVKIEWLDLSYCDDGSDKLNYQKLYEMALSLREFRGDSELLDFYAGKYQGPDIQNLAQPYGIERKNYQVAHFLEALPGFEDFEANPDTPIYGKQKITKATASHLAIRLLEMEARLPKTFEAAKRYLSENLEWNRENFLQDSVMNKGTFVGLSMRLLENQGCLDIDPNELLIRNVRDYDFRDEIEYARELKLISLKENNRGQAEYDYSSKMFFGEASQFLSSLLAISEKSCHQQLSCDEVFKAGSILEIDQVFNKQEAYSYSCSYLKGFNDAIQVLDRGILSVDESYLLRGASSFKMMEKVLGSFIWD